MGSRRSGQPGSGMSENVALHSSVPDVLHPGSTRQDPTLRRREYPLACKQESSSGYMAMRRREDCRKVQMKEGKVATADGTAEALTRFAIDRRMTFLGSMQLADLQHSSAPAPNICSVVVFLEPFGVDRGREDGRSLYSEK